MKKCPYCAEEIQDEAIVCRFCGRSLSPVATTQAPPVPARPAKQGISGWLIGLLIMGGFLFICLCAMVFMAIGRDASSSAPESSVKVNGPISSPTPRPMLGMDLGQFVAKYDSLTDLQKKDFVGQSVGKWVDWQGEVFEVRTDGTVLVNIPETMLSLVTLKGVSQSKAAGLSKGQQIHFTGRISDVSEVLGLYIYVDNVELKP